MASPLRFRHDPQSWSAGRVNAELRGPLHSSIGIESEGTRFGCPGYTTERFELANGDRALFAYDEQAAFWMGNTETPSALWRTNKRGWDEVPFSVARWARRELIADLHDAAPWLGPYSYLSWFFLPVLMAKDGRDVLRRFFREYQAGYPESDFETALSFFDSFLKSGVMEPYRETMAGKLGTSDVLDHGRMAAAMGEFVVAAVLDRAGYDFEPEVAVDSGHALDFRVEDTLIEVTRPQPPGERSGVHGPVEALQESVDAKSRDQLAAHPGTLLIVDCSSFVATEWEHIESTTPTLPYSPTVVLWTRPDGTVAGYEQGSAPLDLASVYEPRQALKHQ